jgi:hypothetical protein
MADNAKTATPKGKSPKASDKYIPQHKKMAMGNMPSVGKGPKTPA